MIRRFRACQPADNPPPPAQALRIGHVVICVRGRRRSAAFIPQTLFRSLLKRINGGGTSENLIGSSQLVSAGVRSLNPPGKAAAAQLPGVANSANGANRPVPERLTGRWRGNSQPCDMRPSPG